MYKFLTILCMMISVTASAQRSGKGELWMQSMNVRECTVDRQIICNTQQVIWGNSADTIGFYFNGKEIYFWPAFDKNLTGWCERHSKPGDQYKLMQDKFGDRYYVRRYSTDKSFVIFIINHKGLPNYSFGFGFTVCE